MDPKLSAIQLVSESSAENNMIAITALLEQLSPKADQLVLLPENALCFADKKHYLSISEALGNGPYQDKLSALAKQYCCYLICGSFPIKSEINGKVYTTSLVFSPQGELVSHYHKIHLFDAQVKDNKKTYKESDTFIPGDSVQTFDWKTAQGCYKVGLAICYDLRFPGLFQTLRKQGAEIILLPAAFTLTTGKVHWQPLLQARAIENQCYMVAANQGGTHLCGRQTSGHSMIISPWGEVLASQETKEGFVCAPFSKITLDEVRSNMPITIHNRFTSVLN